MNKKPTTIKKNQTKSVKPPFYKQKWVIIVGAIILLIVGWIIYSKISLSNHKKEAKLDAEKVVKIAKQAPGTVVYEDIRDIGCATGKRGWFGSYTACKFKGTVVIKNNNDSDVDTEKLEDLLAKSGYARAADSEPVISGKKSIISINVFDKKKAPPTSTMTPQNMFDIDKEIPLAGDEYLYGVVIQSIYSEK